MKRKQEGDIQITGRCWWRWGQRNWRLIRVSVGMVGMSGLSTNGLDESLPRQHGMSHHGKKEEKRVHLLQRLFFPSSKGPTLFNCCGSFYSWFSGTNFYFGACYHNEWNFFNRRGKITSTHL